MSQHSGWIGVDLDGTLAEYDHWRGPQHIGAPIMPMVDRIKGWLAEGREVRIFTARVASDNEVEKALMRKIIRDWSYDVLGVCLEVTNVKDYQMVELWDDRAVQVIPNTGRRADGRD